MRLEIVILTTDPAIVKQLKDDISSCSSLALSYISIKNTSINDYYKENKNAANSYDYIEYNGGINYNTDSNVMLHLSIFEKLLLHDGVLGLSFFLSNVHTKTLYTMIKSMTATNLFETSKARELMVKYYLESCNFHIYANDKELVSFLANNNNNTMTRSQNDVTIILNNNGFVIQSWIPTAYSRPFDELPDYKHYQYQSYGISQEAFVEEMLISFRNTLYVTKKSGSINIDGRATFSNINNSPANDAKNYLVLDRFNGLKEIGKVAAARAAKGFSTELAFSSLTLEKVNITTILMPAAAIAISKIGNSKYTLADIIDTKKEDHSKQHIIATLSYLEKMNYITIIRKN